MSARSEYAANLRTGMAKIERNLKAQARLAHDLRLGIPTPARTTPKDNPNG